MNILNDDTILCTKKRLFLLFMLNMSDWLCTLSLLSTGVFEEANPLMKSVITNPLWGIVVKVAAPLALIVLALSRIKYADSKQLMLSNRICLLGVAVYLLINVYHILCFGFVLFYF